MTISLLAVFVVLLFVGFLVAGLLVWHFGDEFTRYWAYPLITLPVVAAFLFLLYLFVAYAVPWLAKVTITIGAI